MNLLKDAMDGNKPVYLIGIKGTGMCALAELLQGAGMRVSGSDTADTFYTDAILRELKIPFHEGFAVEQVPARALVIHSAAWTDANNVEAAEAVRRGQELLSYTEALGAYSALFDAAGIAGVHGKTTTTALAGALTAALKLPAQVLAGSAISSFGGRCTLQQGSRFFIAETCEYRRHFLAFKPRRIVLTSVESDHQDYYPDYASIRDAFCEYVSLLPPEGLLIYCADESGACEVAASALARGIQTAPYGFSAQGPWRLEYVECADERLRFKVAAFDQEFALRIPGTHNALNAAGALALIYSLYATWHGELSVSLQDSFAEKAVQAFEDFRGSKRRAEVLGEAQGVLFIDDYGHHPTAIMATLKGIKAFYPTRRLVVSFMPHTYSRTAALLDEFAHAFSCADSVILHKIYPSAREKEIQGVDGRALYERTRRCHPQVIYVDDPANLAAVDSIIKQGEGGGIFLTLGAGDNWKLGRALYEQYRRDI
ncbi:MAG: UDP-N-acetylmuramate--L-alanine ligase [Spirochaetaceae bacterium]|jgi:UDP-N-acetylmuramate--alanine ligase|nr:UDP-N-acetylmuramate--L-alanine ligase [Spirochaetaceae bacterium]